VVAAGGEVVSVSIVESAGQVLDQALVRAVARWGFEPGTRDGVAVSTTLTVQHVFRR
jgi:TonB family protein